MKCCGYGSLRLFIENSWQTNKNLSHEKKTLSYITVINKKIKVLNKFVAFYLSSTADLEFFNEKHRKKSRHHVLFNLAANCYLISKGF